MTRIFYDTEFLEDGSTISLISIGLVNESGKTYYAVNNDAPWDRISQHAWLCHNVLPSLPVTDKTRQFLNTEAFKNDPNRRINSEYSLINFSIEMATSDARVKPKWVIANEVRDFILSVPEPELWADYGAYDHVVLCQLWGPMVTIPKGIPWFTNDIQTLWRLAGKPELPKQADGKHNAFGDAMYNMEMYNTIINSRTSLKTLMRSDQLITVRNTEGVVHMCPSDGEGPTPCCGKTPLELPHTDALTTFVNNVTCTG